jgi:TPR repeat protein
MGCCSNRTKEEAEKYKELVMKHGSRVARYMQHKLYVNKDQLKNHNMNGQDDVDSLSQEQFQALDRFTQLEKFFPFYKMDVNGYIFHI